MTKLYYYILFFSTLISFGQQSVSEEDKIYNAVDVFVANPSMKAIENLNQIETDF